MGWEVKQQRWDRDKEKRNRRRETRDKFEAGRAPRKRDEGTDEVVLVTARDEQMIEWLKVVRVTDMESIRFALAAFADATQPVSLRRAQQWVARLVELGLVEKERLTLQDGSAIWATQRATGIRPLNLLGQTFRHEVAVASASARYLFSGWSWARDRKASSYHDHQADGIATRADETELVEVELTPKAIERYAPIVNSHSWRISREGITRVVYLCTADATRMVRREADKLLFRDDKSLIVTITAFDKRGTWIDESGRFPAEWASTPTEQTNPNETLESRVIRARSIDCERAVPASRLF
jgi:hypothetical protein